jgi:3-oxoacyl-(acyl-carrier-protein) synthase
LKKLKLPVYAAFHAPHLPKLDFDAIIGSSPLVTRRLPDAVSLFSGSTESPYAGETVADLLSQALDDICQGKLFLGRALESALTGVASGDLDLKVYLIGPGSASPLKRGVEQAGLADVEIQTPESLPVTGSSGGAEGIAIIGMAGRFPGGENLEAFWDTLNQGKDVHKKVPEDRFSLDLHHDPTGRIKNSTLSSHGCFLDRPGAFDHRLFNMSPREAEQTDPCHRLLLMSTYEALEMAGYHGPAHEETERVGSFIALCTDDWREYNASQNVDLYFVSGGMRAFAAGRLNYFFKWEGPSFTVDTACSSGAAAVQIACASLMNHECDVAVVGGANLITGPNLHAGLSRAGFSSTTGSCKTFDDGADGYCRGEAAGVLILKRLDSAQAQRDNILGVIRSAATNHSAHAPSISQPDAPAQQRLYEHALRQAGLESHEIGYVEVHGTGTQSGDSKEMQSIYSTFAPGRMANNPLYVGGVKANVGHSESVGHEIILKTACFSLSDKPFLVCWHHIGHQDVVDVQGEHDSPPRRY